jgi:hypothetical protein
MPKSKMPINTATQDPLPHIQATSTTFRCVTCGDKITVNAYEPLPWPWLKEHAGCIDSVSKKTHHVSHE